MKFNINLAARILSRFLIPSYTSEYNPIEYLVMPDRKLNYIVLSKVACTTIKATIGKSYGIFPNRNSGLDIHHKTHWNNEVGDLKDLYETYYTFTFVRNPFTRLESCYRDKVIYEGANEDYEEYYFKNYPYDIPSNISFKEFVRIVTRIPDFMADRHFKKQSYILYKENKQKISFIGNFENLTEDWAYIAQKYDFDDKLMHFNKTKKNKANKQNYDRETAELVYEKYEEDIVNFGYYQYYQDLIAKT